MKNIIIVALMTISVFAQAQTNSPMTLTLPQAMQLGLKNRYDVKADHYNIDISENRIDKERKDWIPDVHAEVNMQYVTQLQPTYVPKGFAGFTEPQMLAFGAKNASVFGLALDQPIFKPGIHADVKIAQAQLALQKEKIHGHGIVIKSQIATAYLDALLKKLQYQIARDEERRFGEYQKLAEGKYKNGALIENDYLRAKLDYENARMKTTIVAQNYEIALANLKYQINIPETSRLVLSDSIDNISFVRQDTLDADLMVRRTEIKQLKLQLRENDLQLKRLRQNALPSVSAFGYYAQLYQNKNFHYSESKWWAPHSYVGIKLTVPITRNLSNKNDIRENKLKQDQLSMNLQQERADIQYQAQKATADLQNASHNMASAKYNYRLSQTIFQNQQKQFSIGVFKYADLLDTERSLSSAEQNYIRSVYDYLVARLQYEQAMGVL